MKSRILFTHVFVGCAMFAFTVQATSSDIHDPKVKRLDVDFKVKNLDDVLKVKRSYDDLEVKRSDDDAQVRRSDDTTLSSLQTLLQQQASVIQQLESQLTSTVTRLTSVETVCSQQAQEISTVKNRLDSATRQVAFTVYFSADPTPDYGVHGILRFDHIVTNTANGYDAHTGIFTSPVTGLYVFHLNVMTVNNAASVSIEIIKNGAALDDAYASGNASNDQGNSLVTVHLNKGEKVWAQQKYGATQVRGNILTVFSGFLIQAD